MKHCFNQLYCFSLTALLSFACGRFATAPSDGPGSDSNGYDVGDTDIDVDTDTDVLGNADTDSNSSVIVLRSSLPYYANPSVDEADFASFISNTNTFGLKLFDTIADNETNVVFSPVSIAMVLGMTYAGARGNTAAQMAMTIQNN